MFRRWALCSAAVLLCAGCALPQNAERYLFAVDGTDSVWASRYAGRADNAVHSLGIDLVRARPFAVRLPDGSWVASRGITRQTLSAHGMPSEPGQKHVAWHPDLPVVASLVGRHQYLAFSIDDEDRAERLSLGSCGYAFDEVLRSADGREAFGFPLAVRDLERLFGPPARVERVAIVTGFSCF